jgi:hypothetical protein
VSAVTSLSTQTVRQCMMLTYLHALEQPRAHIEPRPTGSRRTMHKCLLLLRHKHMSRVGSQRGVQVHPEPCNSNSITQGSDRFNLRPTSSYDQQRPGSSFNKGITISSRGLFCALLCGSHRGNNNNTTVHTHTLCATAAAAAHVHATYFVPQPFCHIHSALLKMCIQLAGELALCNQRICC